MKSLFIKSFKEKKYLYFFYRLFLFFFIVFVLDFVTGSLLRHYYFAQKAGSQYRTNYSIDKANADIMIFGSSRAVYHYIPTIFEESLNMSCYNAGSLDQHILYHYAVFKSVLKRHIPRIVVLDVTSEEFKRNKQSYDKLSILLPFYNTHPEVRTVIDLRSPYEKIKLMSKTYPFNSSLLMIAGGNTKYFAERKQDIKGYIPLKKIWKDPIVNSPFPDYEVDNMKLSFFEKILQDCIKNNIRLYLVHSPEYFIHENEDRSLKFVEKLAQKYCIKFMDFTNDPLFTNDPSLFNDPYHLNSKGAKMLSRRIAENLVQIK